MDLQKKLFDEHRGQAEFKLAIESGLDYVRHIHKRSVTPSKQAVDDLAVFSERFPKNMTRASAVIEKLKTHGSPATVAQSGGRYFGFVNGSVLPVGLSARLLADFWDQNVALEVMSPVVSALENTVERWLAEIFGLPDTTAAGFVSGTSLSIFCGLAAARWRLYKNLKWDVNHSGLYNAPKLRIVAGKQAHAAVFKAIALLGFGIDHVELVDGDDQGRMIPSRIPPLDERTILILQAGNVNSGAFDPFDEICQSATDAGCWVHVDGAFGLWAKGSPKFDQLTNGLELAASWSVDGHKTLNTPYDNGIVLCRDREALVSALQSNAPYITYGTSRDGMLYTPEMSRRNRVTELWAILKYLGAEGLEALVDLLHERAVQFASALRTFGFEVLNDVVFNQVLVAFRDDASTDHALQFIQESGVCWCGTSVWHGKKVIRISVCSWATTEDDVSTSVEVFKQARMRCASV